MVAFDNSLNTFIESNFTLGNPSGYETKFPVGDFGTTPISDLSIDPAPQKVIYNFYDATFLQFYPSLYFSEEQGAVASNDDGANKDILIG